MGHETIVGHYVLNMLGDRSFTQGHAGALCVEGCTIYIEYKNAQQGCSTKCAALWINIQFVFFQQQKALIAGTTKSRPCPTTAGRFGLRLSTLPQKLQTTRTPSPFLFCADFAAAKKPRAIARLTKRMCASAFLSRCSSVKSVSLPFFWIAVY